jgi:hypothetical protein
MDMVGMLYKMHVQMTQQPTPPFSYTLPFDYSKVNIEKYNAMKNDPTIKRAFFEECISKFGKEIPYGSS